jgi:hypothetical protein
MVVGGLPNPRPDHAEQIATMALDLLHQSGNFKVRHLPGVPLQLRIGLHTGSLIIKRLLSMTFTTISIFPFTPLIFRFAKTIFVYLFVFVQHLKTLLSWLSE